MALTEMIELLRHRAVAYAENYNIFFSWTEMDVPFSDRIAFKNETALNALVDERKQTAADKMSSLQGYLQLGSALSVSEQCFYNFVTQLTSPAFARVHMESWERLRDCRPDIDANLVVESEWLAEKILDATSNLLTALYNLRDSLERLHAAKQMTMFFIPGSVEALAAKSRKMSHGLGRILNPAPQSLPTPQICEAV